MADYFGTGDNDLLNGTIDADNIFGGGGDDTIDRGDGLHGQHTG